MKRRANLLGCVLTLAFIAALAYGGIVAAGYVWWGRGFAGALAGRHARERVRAASTVYIYDHVIEVERDRVVFRRSLWSTVRRSLIVGGTAALAVVVVLAARRATIPRFTFLGVLLAVGAGTFAILQSRAGEVVVPRGAPQRLEAQWYELGGGRSGTKNTAADESGWQIVLADGTVLIRLPWNGAEDAEIWRGLIAEKIAR